MAPMCGESVHQNYWLPEIVSLICVSRLIQDKKTAALFCFMLVCNVFSGLLYQRLFWSAKRLFWSVLSTFVLVCSTFGLVCSTFVLVCSINVCSGLLNVCSSLLYLRLFWSALSTFVLVCSIYVCSGLLYLLIMTPCS